MVSKGGATSLEMLSYPRHFPLGHFEMQMLRKCEIFLMRSASPVTDSLQLAGKITPEQWLSMHFNPA